MSRLPPGLRSIPTTERARLKQDVLRAGRDWLEADEDDDFKRAEARLKEAAGAYLLHLGWTPPEEDG